MKNRCKPIALVLSKLFLFLIFSVSLFISESFAVDYYANSDEKISGYSVQTGLSFLATYVKDDTIAITLRLKNKEIVLRISDNEAGGIHIQCYLTKTREVTSLSAEDTEALKNLLSAMLKDDTAKNKLGKILLRILNLLYSWPPYMPLEISINNLKINQSGNGIDSDMDNYLASACDVPVPKGLSENICSEMNLLHDGDYIRLAYPLEWIIYPFLGKFYPLWCPEGQEIVGPYPFEEGDCFGRCGKGCIGDGPPNNDLNIFTQNCFNHDACVMNLGLIHPYCNQMFIYCVIDFFYGDSCQ